jgi:hypothetical protein
MISSGLTQTTDPTQLLHLTRALLKASHSIFPSPDITGHNGLDPVSLKKLLKGNGLWEVRKEILGWIIDGMHRCIEYPKDKLSKLTADLKVAYQSDTITAKALKKLRGRMHHASIGMPAGRPLCGPVDKALTDCKGKVTQVKSNKQLKSCFWDFQTLLLVFAKDPAFCKELIPDDPSYVGNCDASKLGAGGVWFAGWKALHPIVWRLEWPDKIKK